MKIRPGHVEVDPTPDGHIMLIAIEDGLGSHVLRLTPSNAAKLGQRLIDVASWMETP
ncbi:hypothetical protein H7J50_19805 [Mycobacterium intermedium]|uniref:hypothetical protein n=1 Tax=Mycobacterium intermedium TaxID=28445 RepID=UPI0012EA1801|nr:hypothetical protein [Mycobacterium intermedium]MCV6966036.1 hypothetical protein [Mycobacterium intermedium]